MVDPVTKISKPFGFCTWSSPHGALCALKLIHGLAVEDGALELKPGKVSEQQMDAWLAQGGEFRDVEVEEARQRIEQVMETRAALPQRTREMLRQEMERAEKRRKQAPSKEHEQSSKDAMKEVQLRRKREDRARERERRVQERAQQEARAVELERQWEEREKSSERARARAARDMRGEVGADLQSGSEALSVSARRARVAATAREREHERREDFEARQSRLIFSGTAPLLQSVAPVAGAAAANTGAQTNGGGGPASKPLLFASQDEEDQEEDDALKQQQMQARMLFVPTDTLYRRKLTPADVEEIVQSIPKEPAELYAHAIDWAFLQVVGALESGAGKPVAEYVAKSITELVGEMPDMVDFIMSLLRKGVKPDELETKMRMVIQDDAPSFVFKLWRFLVYQVKAEQRQRQ